MNDTYLARLVGASETRTEQLELIGGLPQKSFVRSSDGDNEGEETVWELVDGDSPEDDGFEYREAGRPGADYS
jgi:hypothetical protein